MTEAREVWERDRQEYERRQREIMQKLEEERSKRRGGWGINVGPIHVHVDL